jgi:cellulose synthase operon protein C
MMSLLIGDKRVHRKAVLILVGVLVVAGAGVHFLHRYQCKRNAHELFDQAMQMEKEGRLGEGVNYLEQYLGLVPSDTEALAKLGFWLVRDAKSDRVRLRAMMVLDQVLRRNSARSDVRREVAGLAVRLRHFSDARDHLAILRRETPDDPELMYLAGRCEVGAKQYQVGAELFSKAFQLAPAHVELALDYAALLRERMSGQDVADDVIERLVRAEPQALPARLGAARYYFRTGDLDQADKHIRFALNDLSSSTQELLLLAADVALARGKVDDSRGYLERAAKLYPGDAGVNRKLARVELAEGKMQAALARIEQQLRNLSDQPVELWDLAELMIVTGGHERAGAVIDRLAKTGATLHADCLRARVMMGQEKWGEASKGLARVTTSVRPDSSLARDAYLGLAECYRRLGNPDQWLEACRHAVECDPDSKPARHGLVRALAAQGKLDLALMEYSKVKEAPTELRLQVGHLLIARGLRLAEPAATWKEVEQLLKDLPDKERDKVEAQLLRARLLVARKKLDEARALMESQCERDPKQVDAWIFLAELAEMQKRRSEVPGLLDQAAKKAGKRIELSLALARYWTRTGGAEARTELLRLEDSLATSALTEGDRLRTALATSYAALAHWDDAERLWLEQAKQQPQSLGAHFNLLELAFRRANEETLVRVLGEIRRIEAGTGPTTAYGEAAHRVLQARNGRKAALAEARKWLEVAGNLRPSWSRVPLMEAATYEVDGQKEKAVEKYKAALDRGESRLGVVRRTLELMYELRMYNEAGALLHKVPEQALPAAKLDRFAVHLMLATPQEDGADPLRSRQQALDLARKAVAGDSKEARDFLWLGQIAALAKQMPEAEKAFRRACQLDAANPDTWVTLILFLARTNPKKAEVELTNAHANLPADLAPLALAPGFESLGKLEQAEIQYEAARAAKPNDPARLRILAAFFARTGQSAKTELVLRKLLDPAAKAPKDTVAWARRALAVTLAGRINFQRFKEAQKLLDENAQEHGETLDDQIVRAIVLATQPIHRREAIRLCETLAAKQFSMLPEMQFFLAQQYEADGNWRTAKLQFMRVLGTQEKNPVILWRYAHGLLRHGEVDEARPIVDRLAAVMPESWETAELKARVLHSQSQKDKARDVLLTYTDRPKARLDLAAVAMDQLGHSAEAEKLFKRHVATAKSPEGPLLLARHLAKHGRTAEALSLCEKAWTNCPPELVAQYCVAILKADPATSEQRTLVEGWIAKAIQANPKNLALQGLLAELHVAPRKGAEACIIYRGILRQDPDNIYSLNNLAFLQALKQENLAECLEMIDRAIAVAGPHPSLLDTRAVVHLQNGTHWLAVEDLNQVLAQRSSATDHFHLAQAHHQAKNRPAATAALKKARELGLQVQQLHALEQAAFHKLAKELE